MNHYANAEQMVFEANTHHEAIRMAGEDFMRLENPLVGEFRQTAITQARSFVVVITASQIRAPDAGP